MSSGPSDGTNPSAESPSPNFETVFGAIDIPALILDADGDVVVWNEPLETLLDVDRAAAEAVDEIGTMIYEDRELILAEKVCRHPETADEFYDIGVADSDYALLQADGHPTYEDTSTATGGSGADLWFLATPLYVDDEFVGAIEFVQQRADSERRRREMEELIDELREALAAFQAGDYTARAEYAVAESILQDEEVELLDQVNDLAQMREVLRTQVRETEQTKRQLERRNEQLERQNERLEQFASVVSHDLRSPLNVARGRVELAQGDGEPEHLEDALDAMSRMEALIDNLLTLARGDDTVGEVEGVDLADAAADAWDVVSTPGATLEVAATGTVEADPSRHVQLLQNLFRNAAEHGGSDVTVTVGDLPDGFFVADDGPGIPPERHDEVFDAGYSTGRDGHGLGLQIVEAIAESHGWSVALSDSADGGARFEIAGVDCPYG